MPTRSGVGLFTERPRPAAAVRPDLACSRRVSATSPAVILPSWRRREYPLGDPAGLAADRLAPRLGRAVWQAPLDVVPDRWIFVRPPRRGGISRPIRHFEIDRGQGGRNS